MVTSQATGRTTFHFPYTINMSNNMFGFSGMLQFEGKLWMNEIRPSSEGIRVSNSRKRVSEKLQVAFEQPDREFKRTSVTPEVHHDQSREMVLVEPNEKRTRLRTAKTVEMASKTFRLEEIYDSEGKSSPLNEFLATMWQDQVGSCRLSVFDRLEGWKIETRARANGKYDKFYHHVKSQKMFRSFLMVRKFIKNTASVCAPRRRPQKAADQKAIDLGSPLCNHDGVSSQQSTLKRKRNALQEKPVPADDYQIYKSQNHSSGYFTLPADQQRNQYYPKLPLQLLR